MTVPLIQRKTTSSVMIRGSYTFYPTRSKNHQQERRNSCVYFKTRTAAALEQKKACSPRGLFECKACKKVFRTRRWEATEPKKVKGCYAAKQDESDGANINSNDQEFFPASKLSSSAFQFEAALVGAARRKSKVHECSICHRVFNSGQALGGHKRCHWIISNSPEPSAMPTKFQFQDHNKPHADVSADKLDLNVPTWAHIAGVRRDPRNPLSFDVSTDVHLQPSWIGHHAKAINGDDEVNNNINASEKAKSDVKYSDGFCCGSDKRGMTRES